MLITFSSKYANDAKAIPTPNGIADPNNAFVIWSVAGTFPGGPSGSGGSSPSSRCVVWSGELESRDCP